MSISEHVEEFAGLPVQEFVSGETETVSASTAYRVTLDYDAEESGVTFYSLLNDFLETEGADQVVALIIGAWNQSDSQLDSSDIVAELAAARDQLPALKALFLGDITYDECEISWIQQSDVSPVLSAFPALEQLRIRGADGLRIGSVRHEGLKSLAIESGGLPGSVVRPVAAADFPNLEHLELWLGSPGYGGDATTEDLTPILSGGAFPRLKSLGLRNCEWANDLATALADAPVLRRIETLDLSLGNLGDEGAVALINGGNLSALKRLDIHHHYVSDEILDGLRASGVELNADDRRTPDEYSGERHYYISVSE
jgi:hypothetical protein